MLSSDLLFAITINRINVITCFIENYSDDPEYIYNVADLNVTTDPFIMNKPVDEGSIISIKSLKDDYSEQFSLTYLITILLELDLL